MINREATIRWKGYDPNDLTPNSSKRVWVICNKCQRGRWVRMADCYDNLNLCLRCAMEKLNGDKEYQEKIKENGRKISENDEWRKNQKAAAGKCAENPIWQENVREANKKVRNRPEYKKNQIEFGRKRAESEDFQKAIKNRKYSSKICIICNYEFIPNNSRQLKCENCMKLFKMYCPIFKTKIIKAVRKYFNNVCYMTGLPDPSGTATSVHHVGYDKRCGCDATQFCIFVPVTKSWNSIFNGSKEHNRWYWYSFLMNKIFMEHPNYFTYHIPVWGMNELEYNYSYVFEKFRKR